MYCADEEVDLVMKGGNYGWRVFEGPLLFNPPSTPGGNTSADAINAIAPVMGYYHNAVNKNVGSASITGGYVYRSMTDPCLNDRYLYADLYAKSMWAGVESPEGSGVYNVSALTFGCSKNSPILCDFAAGSSLSSLDYIFSFGEDNARDVYQRHGGEQQGAGGGEEAVHGAAEQRGGGPRGGGARAVVVGGAQAGAGLPRWPPRRQKLPRWPPRRRKPL